MKTFLIVLGSVWLSVVVGFLGGFAIWSIMRKKAHNPSKGA